MVGVLNHYSYLKPEEGFRSSPRFSLVVQSIRSRYPAVSFPTSQAQRPPDAPTSNFASSKAYDVPFELPLFHVAGKVAKSAEEKRRAAVLKDKTQPPFYDSEGQSIK